MIIVNDIRSGQSFIYEGNLYQVIDIAHNKTAMRQMIIKLKVKNLRTGSIIELSFTGGDKLETAHIEKKEMQYLYDDGDNINLMDLETYEQIALAKDRIEWELKFLKENDNVLISMYENEILGIILPDKVALKVVECEAAVKGDTTSGAMKNAKLETGLEVKVPLFIEQDEEILVTTADGKYSSRA